MAAKSIRRAPKEADTGFTEDEKAAMRERAAELKGKRGAKAGAAKTDGEAEVLAKIAEMPPADRALAERLHALVKAHAPGLSARTWYGMPAYTRDGETVCFFQSSHRFKTRYATLGFSDKARLDDGALWPTAFALKALDKATEERVAALLQRAVG